MFFQIDEQYCRAEVLSRQYVLRYPFVGGWQIKATVEASRTAGVLAGEWMFISTPNLPPIDSYSYQVIQYGQESKTDEGLPCFLSGDDAIAFLKAVAFAGEIIRYQNWRPGVCDRDTPLNTVFAKPKGIRQIQQGRIQSMLPIEKARSYPRLLARYRQRWRPSKDDFDFRYYE